METTINKTAVLKLKESIKNASEKQKFYKNQRKTVKLQGKKEMEPWEATMKHHHNREILHLMFMAYAVMRDKSMVEAGLKHFDEEWQRDEFFAKVNRMVEMYEKEAEKDEN